jgi:hypothetical protein
MVGKLVTWDGKNMNAANRGDLINFVLMAQAIFHLKQESFTTSAPHSPSSLRSSRARLTISPKFKYYNLGLNKFD